MKVIINNCYGGASVSKEVFDELNLKWDGYGYLNDTPYKDDWRTHEDVIKAVEKLGSKRASGRNAELKIVEVPDDVEWTIEEYDGIECVAEVHRTWS